MLNNLRLAFLLHFYQPWWQYEVVLEKIVNQCYRPILELVRKTNGFCFTVNINLCLLEQLESRFADVISGFKEAMEAGLIELVGSTAHHPIFPLLPANLQLAHLQEDEDGKKNRFGLERNCRGIFLPEMAFGKKDLKVLRNYGYRWTVLDDEPFNAVYGYAPCDHIISAGGLRLYMRSSRWSNMISSGSFSFYDIESRMDYELPNWTQNHPAYLVIAMDAETFGHHHRHLVECFLKPMLEEWACRGKIVPVENIDGNFPLKSSLAMPDGSWSTTRDDVLTKNDPYPLWNSRFNIYHSKLWYLVNQALEHFEDCPTECLQITSSCHWWWISGRPHWEPECMKKGARKAMDIIKGCGSPEEIESILETYNQLIQLS